MARFTVLIFVLVLHEYAHGWTAYKCGDSTAKQAGRLTLNPLKHFDVPGLLMMLFLPIGYAKPVPIVPYHFRRPRRDYILVSAAGVIVNISIAFIMALPFVAYYEFCTRFINENAFGEFLLWLLYFFVSIDVGLVLFNLLPIFPLDGFRIVEGLSRPRNPFVVFMRENGTFILIALFVVNVLIFVLGQAFTIPMWVHYLDILGYWLPQGVMAIVNLFAGFWQLILGLQPYPVTEAVRAALAAGGAL
ncbi:MAG: site-2 protease family protein [Clostridiales bacterium]|nr:site-2 protease family protein [Clostridiales bacterium]